MTISKQYLKQFNRPDTVAIVTSYPAVKGESAVQNAVANYSRQLVRAMTKKCQLIVLAEVLSKPEAYIEDGALILRVYEKNSYHLSKQILTTVKQMPAVKKYLIQFEFNIFGKPVATLFTLRLFWVLRLHQKRVTFTFHQVVDSLEELSGHLGMSPKGNLKTAFFNLGMRWFYRIVGWTSQSVVVHTLFLKERLAKYVSAQKIVVIPHGVDQTYSRLTQRQARTKLGLRQNQTVMLLFGYLAWYKGTDWLMKKIVKIAADHPDKHFHLVVAGGLSATLKDRPHYQKYVTNLNWLAQQHPNLITITGYVSDQMKATYYQAADVVVFPYRAAMSESGPLAHAFTYKKPFLASLERVTSFKDEHVHEVFNENGLELADVAFYLHNGNFEQKLIKMLESKVLEQSVIRVCHTLADERSWEKTSALYTEVLSNQDKSEKYIKLWRPAMAWAK